ncbi:hypothetical protein SLS60_011784 [Paraconiothyrium brasiliense]|uniref:Uncharacterized protein n=1 Tax=Paraconiothyrium brasiliense TaxID=300254 RepID=A0ABR3QHZ5_9PLEO
MDLFPLADVFCFFSDDLGGVRPIARCLALWLDQSDRSSTPPTTALPSVLIGEFLKSNRPESSTDSREAKTILRPRDDVSARPFFASTPSARAVTAAPGFFPPVHIDDIGTFQDAALFPHAGQPDFVVFLGTGEPGPGNYDVSTRHCRSWRKNNAKDARQGGAARLQEHRAGWQGPRSRPPAQRRA